MKRMLAAAAAAGVVLAMPAAAQITMKIASPTINEVSHEWMKAMKAGVEKRSGGRIRVELYPANQLGQLPAQVEGVAVGTIEIAIPAAGFVVGLEPRFQVFEAPGLFDSLEHAQRVFGDPEVRKRLATFGGSKGIEPLVTFVNGPLMMIANRPVRTVSDFKGLKVRAPGGAPIQTEPFKRLGASPLSMGLGEVLPALQNRTIDAATGGIAIFTTYKYHDVSKHLTYLPGSFLVATAIVNRGFLKKLGPDLEAVVRAEAARNEKLFGTWGIEDVGRVEATWRKHGGQLYRLSQADAEEYLKLATAAAAPILNANPQIREDYAAILAAARRHRR